MDILVEVFWGFGSLFYIVNPFATMFKEVKDLPDPDYVAKVRFGQLLYYRLQKDTAAAYQLGNTGCCTITATKQH